MATKRQFGEGPIFTISNYIWWFFLGNFYFTICSLPLLFIISPVILTTQFKYSDLNPILLFIGLILEGPALTALYSVMGKLVREKDVNLTRDYFKAYKVNFLQSSFMWGIQVLVLQILYIDLKFFAAQSFGAFVRPIVLIMMLLVLVISLYTLPILSRFYFPSKEVFKLSFFYSIRKFQVTIFNIVVLILSYYVMTYLPISMLFIASLIGYAIMFNEKDILKELEEKVKANQPKDDRKAEVDDGDIIFTDEKRNNDK